MAGIYGMGLIAADANLSQDVVAYAAGEGAFGQYVAGAYDSSGDYWKLTAEGELVYDGDGWLRNEAGDYINADGSVTPHEQGPSETTIGAGGIETGLLNILHGGEMNRSYDSFTEEQIAAAQRLMMEAGMVHDGRVPRVRLWDGKRMEQAPFVGLSQLNMEKTLDMQSVMQGYGETVATEVFVNLVFAEANRDRLVASRIG